LVEFFNENGSKSGIPLADGLCMYCLSLRTVFNAETDPAKNHRCYRLQSAKKFFYQHVFPALKQHRVSHLIELIQKTREFPWHKSVEFVKYKPLEKKGNTSNQRSNINLPCKLL